jgi:eukaryotic-like serine/threonine-protein kinase
MTGAPPEMRGWCVAAVLERGPSPDFAVPEAAFGRYRVLGQLGAGGTGIVLAAHDPQLDRRVAIKLLRADPPAGDSKVTEHTVRLDGDGQPRDLAREQLVAEARALARVSHPNLVAVFEVGEVDGRVFLAMEHVDGETLRAWLRRPRSTREIAAAFAQAGRGLAAAHAAGLVHGDFKPDNALVDRSGRVRVIDFGLRAAAGGARVGTPRYMAPEQIAGRPVDARADQFALAVALYEALYGAPPFREATSDEELARIRLGEDARRPPARRGSRRLERVVLRGLAREPRDRLASMDELVALLERASRPATRAAVLGGAIVVAAIAAVGAALAERAADPCAGVEQHLAGMWNRDAAARMAVAFAASGRPYASSSYERAQRGLDAYAAAWTDARRAACEAARSGEQSAALVDRRVACLDSRRLRLGALVQLLARADAALVDRALEMTADLEPIAACSDGEALLAGTPPLADPAARAELAALERDIATAEVVIGAGRAAEGERLTASLLARARALDHAPIVAQVARLRGQALEEVGLPAEAYDALFEAVRAGERAGAALLTAGALIDLVRVAGVRLKRENEAKVLARTAEAALERSGPRQDVRLRPSLWSAEGRVDLEASHLPRALDLLSRALAARRSILPPDHPDLAASEGELGNVLVRAARYREARVHLEAALGIRRRVFGDQHPLTASALLNLAVSYQDEGQLDEARSHLEAARAAVAGIEESAVYPKILNNLGNLETSAGKFTRALRHHEDALAIRRRLLGPDHPDVASSLHNLGGVYADMGDSERALELHQSALDQRRRSLGENNRWTASSLGSVADDLRWLGRPAEALERSRAALAMLVAALGPDHPAAGYPLSVQGGALVDLGRAAEAVPLLERALPLLRASSYESCVARFHLARALAATGATSRSRELANAARQDMVAAGRDHLVAAIDAWLAGRPWTRPLSAAATERAVAESR